MTATHQKWLTGVGDSKGQKVFSDYVNDDVPNLINDFCLTYWFDASMIYETDNEMLAILKSPHERVKKNHYPTEALVCWKIWIKILWENKAQSG